MRAKCASLMSDREVTQASAITEMRLLPSSSRSDTEDDDEWLPRKPVPEWAQPSGLAVALQRQHRVDPDKVFDNKVKTCPLEEIFAVRSKQQPLHYAPGSSRSMKHSEWHVFETSDVVWLCPGSHTSGFLLLLFTHRACRLRRSPRTPSRPASGATGASGAAAGIGSRTG